MHHVTVKENRHDKAPDLKLIAHEVRVFHSHLHEGTAFSSKESCVVYPTICEFAEKDADLNERDNREERIKLKPRTQVNAHSIEEVLISCRL